MRFLTSKAGGISCKGIWVSTIRWRPATGASWGAALSHYKEGFVLIAQGYVGSSGTAAIPGEFKTFGDLIWRLSPEIRAEWQEELRVAWSSLPYGSTQLLARLEELY